VLSVAQADGEALPADCLGWPLLLRADGTSRYYQPTEYGYEDQVSSTDAKAQRVLRAPPVNLTHNQTVALMNDSNKPLIPITMPEKFMKSHMRMLQLQEFLVQRAVQVGQRQHKGEVITRRNDKVPDTYNEPTIGVVGPHDEEKSDRHTGL